MPNKDKGNSTKKKASPKKTETKRKSKGKGPPINRKNSIKTNKPVAPTSRCDLNNLTDANISSLRWDNAFGDPMRDHDRIEQYKELRRQRYYEAREQAIQTLMQRMQIKTDDVFQNSIII